MKDFSKMTDKELLDLKKMIEEERNKRNKVLSKAELKAVVRNELGDLFQKRDKVPANYQWSSDPYSRVVNSIFTICDYTLGNFKGGKRTNINTYDLTWTANGPYIYENAENYKALVEDLCKVIKKHFINPEDKNAEIS